MVCQIELLGELRIVSGERVITRFRTQKAAGLIAYLAIFRDRVHTREVTSDLFWPDKAPEAGRQNLTTIEYFISGGSSRVVRTVPTAIIGCLAAFFASGCISSSKSISPGSPLSETQTVPSKSLMPTAASHGLSKVVEPLDYEDAQEVKRESRLNQRVSLTKRKKIYYLLNKAMYDAAAEAVGHPQTEIRLFTDVKKKQIETKYRISADDLDCIRIEGDMGAWPIP